MATHIEKILVDVALLVLLLEKDVSLGVDDQDLAILGNDPLPNASRRHGGVARRVLGSIAALASLLGGGAAVLLALHLFHHASLLSVHGHGRAGLVVFRLGHRSGRWFDIDARDTHVATLGGIAGKLDVALDKLALALPAHVQHHVVNCTAADEEQAKHDSAEAGAVAVVVVVGALPQREAIGEKVVVAVARGSLKDVGNQRQASLQLRGPLYGGLDLGRRGALGDLRALLAAGAGSGLGLFGAQLLLDLVGVQGASQLAVGLANVVLRGRGGDAQDVVKRRGRVRLECGNLIADAKDFAI